MSDGGPRREIDAVVFDMDGVLIDSEPYWRDAEIEIFGSIGVELTREMTESTIGMRIADVVEHWYARSPWPEPARTVVAERILQGVIERVRAHGAVMRGAVEAISWFERLDLRLGLASSSPLRLIEAILETLGLAGRFEVALSAEDLPGGKPDPAVYLLAAEMLGVAPGRCLAIEDSPAGVRAARSAGMACIGVPSLAPAETVAAAGPDALVTSLEDLDDATLAIAGVVPASHGRSSA